jgi:hypothetical protein
MSYLSYEIRHSEPVFAEKTGKGYNKVVGYIWRNDYYQEIDTKKHTMRIWNARGIDTAIYTKLKMRHIGKWIDIDCNTGEKISIPIHKITILREYGKVHEKDMGFGQQIFVSLSDFNDKLLPPKVAPAIQGEMF